MKCGPNIDQLDQIFRSDSKGFLSSDTKVGLHKKFWSENASLDPISQSNRCICWRYLFCLISPINKNQWANDLSISVAKYLDLKSRTSPSIINVGLDPLSDENPDILSFFDSIEKVKSIELDLNRLYMSGIDDEYFQTKRRKGILQSILLIWSVQNPSISYRQGMHEIVGTILYCIERELDAWNSLTSIQLEEMNPLIGAFTEDTVEAHTYWLFTGVLKSLGALYDPTLLPPTDSFSSSSSNSSSSCGHGDHQRRNEQNSLNNGVPRAVLFLLEFQGRYLRDLDPELWNHLRSNDIHPQFFGLRWSRLLLGREFKFADTHVLRIWDCLFSADVVDSEEKEGEKEIVKLENREIIPRHIPDVRHGYSIDTSTSSSSSDSIFDSKSPSSHPYPEYLSDGSQVQVQSMGSGSAGGYPPMLTALRDFMLAMLIHMRAEIIDGDSSVILSLLMRFPAMEDLGPIFRIVTSLRRGLLPSPVPVLRHESDLPEVENKEPLHVSCPSTSTLPLQNGRIKGEDWDTPGTGPVRATAASSLLPLGQALMNAPAAWLSTLDFKSLSVPSMSTFSTDNLTVFGRQGETVGSSRNCLDGQMVESSVPFLSPFPSPTHHVLVPASSFTANTKQTLSQNAVATTSVAEGSLSNLPTASCKEAEEGSEGMFDVDLEVPRSSLSCLSVGPASVEPALCKPSLPASTPTLNCTPSSNPTGKPGPSPPQPERKTGELIDLNSTTIPIPVTSITDITSNKLYGMLPSRWKRDDGKSDAAEQSWLFAVASTPARFSSSLEFLIGDCSGGSTSSTSSSGHKKNPKERVLDPNHLVSEGPLRLPVETVDKNMPHHSHHGADMKVGGTSEIPPILPTGSAMYDVRDRLLCIAEDLLNEQHTRISSDDSAAVAVEGDTIDPKRDGMIYCDDGSGKVQVLSEVEALQAPLKAESRQRTDTAKKLLLLANIISGRASIQEYASLYDKVPEP